MTRSRATARRVMDPRHGRTLLVLRTLNLNEACAAARSLDDVADTARLEVVEHGQRYMLTSTVLPGFRRTSARNASPGFLLRETYVRGDRVRVSHDPHRWQAGDLAPEYRTGVVVSSPASPWYVTVQLDAGARWILPCAALDLEAASS